MAHAAITNALYALNPDQGEQSDSTAAQMWLRTTLPPDHPNYLTWEYVQSTLGFSYVSRRAVERRDSLVVLVSDALAFTPELSPHGRDVLVGALRHAATKPVTEADEVMWFKEMLDAGLQVTAAFDPDFAARLAAKDTRA